MAERKRAKKGTQQYVQRTGKAPKGFTDEERAAMRERAQELKAVARRGPRAGKADEESQSASATRRTSTKAPCGP